MLTHALRTLDDHELHRATVRQAKAEQSATLDLLYHLVEVRRRRLYGYRGFSSLWEYVRSLGYSESGTGERIRAMELMMGNEKVVAEKLRTNELSLTTASQIQIYVRKMNQNAHRVTTSDALALIEAASNKSKKEVEALLLERTPEVLRPHLVPEKIRQLTPELQEIRMVVDAEMQELIRRYKELKGEGSLLEIFREVLKDFMLRNDPLRKEPPAKAAATRAGSPDPGLGTSSSNSKQNRSDDISRHVPEGTRRFVFRRAGGQCEHVGPDGLRCRSRYRLQIDHISPFAVSKDHSHSNLRALCATHNTTQAIDYFGWEKIGPYLERPMT